MVYDGTMAGSPLRRLMVDLQVCWGTELWMEDDCESHPEYLADVARAFCEKALRREAYDKYRGKKLDAKDYVI